MSEQPTTTPKKLMYNTCLNVLTLVSSAVVGFFLMPFFYGQLGAARYGVWLPLGGSIYRYAPLLGIGLNSAINRYVPVYLAKRDEQGIQRVINTSLFFFSTVAIVLMVASLVIYCNVGTWFKIKPELVSTAGVLVLVVGCCFAFAMPLQVSGGILSGLQRYDIISLAMLATLLLRTIVLVVLLSRGYGLLTMGLAFGLSEIGMRASQTIFARKLLPGPSLSLKYIDFGLLKEMLAYGINTFLYTMGAIIIHHASLVIIAILLDTEATPQFSFAIAGVFLLSQFLRAFTRAIKPAVSDLDARDDRWRVKEIAFLTQKYSLLLIIPGGCFLAVMGREFLTVWVGEKFQDPTVIGSMGVIMTILTVGHCFMLAQLSNFLVLVGRGQHRVFGVLTGIMALLCVSASVVSVKVFKLGLVGIAWSNLLPMVLISGVILPIYFNRTMKISAGDSVLRVWWPALLGCMPSVVLISVWKYVAPPDSWVEIFAVVFAAIAVTFLSSWLFSLSELERKRFLTILVRT